MKIAVFRPYRTAIFFARVRCSARFLRDIHQEFSETEAKKRHSALRAAECRRGRKAPDYL